MNIAKPQTDAELAELSRTFESWTPQQIMRWSVDAFGPKLTMATAFGPEGCCLIAMLAEVRDETGVLPDIFNLDTGYQFGQTLTLRQQLQQKYNLQVRLVSGRETVKEFEARHGGPLYRRDPDACCGARKVVPLAEAVQGFEAWITAIRREQTPERATAPIIGHEAKFPMLKINPLANWTRDQVWDYIRDHDVPTNPLHAQGFPSIGCWPCTRAVKAGEDERAGRWAGLEKRECGLHLGVSHAAEQAFDAESGGVARRDAVAVGDE